MEAETPPPEPTAYRDGRTPSQKKFALLYLLLIGLPLLGAILVLRLGKSIDAPHSVKGRWSLETQGRIASALECRAPTGDKEKCTLDVTQSGSQLRLSLQGARDIQPLAFKGALEGTDVEARAKSRAASGRRPAAETVQLRADLETATPEKLEGQLEIGGCPEPVRVQFRATREAKAP